MFFFTLNLDLFTVFCDFIYFYDWRNHGNCILVYLDIFMNIIEAQNRTN